jgi:hypothetical protein
MWAMCAARITGSSDIFSCKLPRLPDGPFAGFFRRSGETALQRAAERGAMSNDGAVLVAVQRGVHDARLGEVRLSDLQAPHWSQPPGARRAMLHAYVAPSQVSCGDLLWPNDAGSAARVRVCVPRSHNTAESYLLLAELADLGTVSARF